MTEARDPLGQLGRLRQHLEADLTERDVERLVHGGAELRQRRRISRALGTGLVLGAVSAAGLLWLVRAPGGPSAPVLASSTPAGPPAAATPSAPVPASASAATRMERVVRLRDESRATLLEPQTQVVVEEDAAERIRLRLAMSEQLAAAGDD